MRITTSMMSKHYTTSLNKTLSDLNKASDQATSLRKFTKVSEDPFSAAKAFSLRREYQQNESYQSTLSDIESQLETAQSSMLSVNSIVQEVSSGDMLQAITGTMAADDRTVIAAKLRKLQDALMSSMNTKYADKYVFGGAKTDAVPFTTGDNGELLFRGIDVNTGAIAAGTTTSMNGATIRFGKNTGTAFNGYTIRVADGGAGSADAVSLTGTEITVSMDLSAGKTNTDLLNTLKGTTGLTGASGDVLDFSGMTMEGETGLLLTAGLTSPAATDTVGAQGLKALAEEKAYVNLDMGLRFNSDGSIVSQSVFNTAIPGLSFLGYGTKTDNADVSNNLYTLLGQIADQLENEHFSMDSIQPYLDNFNKKSQDLLSEVTKSGTSSSFLEVKKNQLETMSLNISTKISNVEYVDSAEAYMNYQNQQYAYMAALQVGTNILQPTILDFMN